MAYEIVTLLDTQAFIVGIQELMTQIIEPVCQQNPDNSRDYLAHLELFNQYSQGGISSNILRLDVAFSCFRQV